MASTRTLEVLLNDVLVGHLTHYPDERTMFVVDQTYLEYGPQRPILSLSMSRPGDEDATQKLLADPRHKSSIVKAPPYFSNLLPEGGLRQRIATALKTHEDREFDLLSALGDDLPGGVVLRPADTPEHMRYVRRNPGGPIDVVVPPAMKFSLGGMQLKFSMQRQGERFTLPSTGKLGDFIVKPPSADHQFLPNVEAATMEVARMVGIDVPEVLLVPASAFESLSGVTNIPKDAPFYAVRRFDRPGENKRRHTEDFAQVFNLRTNQKYQNANYEQIAKTLLLYAGGIEDVREMTRRLVFNVLMGNGDAHVKNWSLLYENPQRPRLSPAYDLVTTIAYTQYDNSVALNMGGVKHFDHVTLAVVDRFLSRIGVLDQQRESAIAMVREMGKAAVARWESVFREKEVPDHLIRKIAQHQSGLALFREIHGNGIAKMSHDDDEESDERSMRL